MATLEALEQRLAELESRVQCSEDVESIRNLKARYGELTDRRYELKSDAEKAQLPGLAREIADLFTEDAVWDGGRELGLCRGREEIARRFENPTLEFAWHFFMKPRIQVEGDRASARWDILSPCTTLDQRAFWMAGVQDDEYRRVKGEWKLSRLSLRFVFMAPYEHGWARPKPD